MDHKLWSIIQTIINHKVCLSLICIILCIIPTQYYKCMVLWYSKFSQDYNLWYFFIININIYLLLNSSLQHISNLYSSSGNRREQFLGRRSLTKLQILSLSERCDEAKTMAFSKQSIFISLSIHSVVSERRPKNETSYNYGLLIRYLQNNLRARFAKLYFV